MLNNHRNRTCVMLPAPGCTCEMPPSGRSEKDQEELTKRRREDQIQGPRVRREHESRDREEEPREASWGGGPAVSNHSPPHRYYRETANGQVLGESSTSVCPSKLKFSSEDSSVDAKFSSRSELCRTGSRRPTVDLEDPSATPSSWGSRDGANPPASLVTTLALQFTNLLFWFSTPDSSKDFSSSGVNSAKIMNELLLSSLLTSHWSLEAKKNSNDKNQRKKRSRVPQLFLQACMNLTGKLLTKETAHLSSSSIYLKTLTGNTWEEEENNLTYCNENKQKESLKHSWAPSCKRQRWPKAGDWR